MHRVVPQHTRRGLTPLGFVFDWTLPRLSALFGEGLNLKQRGLRQVAGRSVDLKVQALLGGGRLILPWVLLFRDQNHKQGPV